jgi:hypothetical protein
LEKKSFGRELELSAENREERAGIMLAPPLSG